MNDGEFSSAPTYRVYGFCGEWYADIQGCSCGNNPLKGPYCFAWIAAIAGWLHIRRC